MIRYSYFLKKFRQTLKAFLIQQTQAALAHLQRRLRALLLGQARPALDIGVLLEQRLGQVEVAMYRGVGEGRPVLRLWVGHEVGGARRGRLGVHVGAGVQEHVDHRLVAADAGQHERGQPVLVHCVDLHGYKGNQSRWLEYSQSRRNLRVRLAFSFER